MVGARPQFIKLAALHQAIILEPRLEHKVVHSGQHYDAALSDSFFAEFDLPQPDFFLGIGSSSPNKQIADCILALDQVFSQYTPDLVIIYGDTNTTAAAAIASAKRHLPIAHVEAGLREFNKQIPEESNKLIADSLSDIWFAPTETAVQNLAKEGREKHVVYTGDIVLDLLFKKYGRTKKGPFQGTEYCFFTCHRAANTDNPDALSAILKALHQLPFQVVFPVHPRTRHAIVKYNLASLVNSNSIQMIEPCGFWETQKWVRNAKVVVTDSGGLIKEAYFHQTPCVVIDTQTEWLESVDEGWTTVVGPDTKRIENAVMTIKVPQEHQNRLGDGLAGKRMTEYLIDFLDGKK